MHFNIPIAANSIMAIEVKNRIETIDLLKGLVMIIMALDHTREFLHAGAYVYDPTNLYQTTLFIFFTRWITHFCAPTFCFLAGISAYLSGKRKTKSALSLFLLKRGLWLVFIELIVVNFAWHFDVYFRAIDFQVIWALGVSMIILSALVYLPRVYILILSCLFIFFHNLLDTIHFDGNVLWSIIHEMTCFKFSNTFKLYIDYPIVPFFAIMSLGYCIGNFYDKSFDSIKRKKILNVIGVMSIVLFALLRWINVYGDPVKWIQFNDLSLAFMSFLNLTKYPTSLLFLLLTLGAAILFLANSEKRKGKVVSFFITFGRVPFFFYIVHLYLIHFIALIFAQASGFGWQSMILSDWVTELVQLKGFGFSLKIVYLVWIGVIAFLYPLCKEFNKYKLLHKEKWWLSYF